MLMVESGELSVLRCTSYALEAMGSILGLVVMICSSGGIVGDWDGKTGGKVAVVGGFWLWAAHIEMACKPCLEKDREAIDRNLNPYYDTDDDTICAPLNPNPPASVYDNDSDATFSVVKAV
ncbi:unnamed protein product [Ilex paraguariensis]|uniref:Uncharacterized protein n=1 Tax=Ilex paraguariensis TaxID=185542 RepID=A0ABC8UFG6_9AQUA